MATTTIHAIQRQPTLERGTYTWCFNSRADGQANPSNVSSDAAYVTCEDCAAEMYREGFREFHPSGFVHCRECQTLGEHNTRKAERLEWAQQAFESGRGRFRRR